MLLCNGEHTFLQRAPEGRGDRVGGIYSEIVRKKCIESQGVTETVRRNIRRVAQERRFVQGDIHMCDVAEGGKIRLNSKVMNRIRIFFRERSYVMILCGS